MRRTAPRPRLEPLEDRTTPAAGQLDPTFGTGGLTTAAFDRVPGGADEATAVALQPDGKVVVVGFALPDSGGIKGDIAVLRLTADGLPDPTFDGDGRKLIAFDFVPDGEDRPAAVAVQPDGKILIAGYVETFTSGSVHRGQMVLVRLNADGSYDSTFDGDGVRVVSPGARSTADALALQPDGKIVVAGSASQTTDNADDTFAVLRFLPDGTPDAGFATAGVYLSTFHGNASSVTVDPAGRIVVAGSGDGLGAHRSDFAAVRLTPVGTPDPTFDGDGAAFVAFDTGGGMRDSVSAVFVQPDGKLVLAGSSEQAYGVYQVFAFAAARLNADGSPDVTYGTGGKVTLPFAPTGSSSYAYAAALQPDGKLLLAGTASVTLPATPDFDFAAARLNEDGSPDPAFDGDGRVLVPFNRGSQNVDIGSAATLLPDGRLVIVGYAEGIATGNDFAVVRLQGDAPPPPPPPLPVVSFSGTGYTTPGNAMSVATGDFNGDGKIDAVAGNSGGVTVFLNDGAGALGTGTDYGTGSWGPRTVGTADLTGDGKIDIIVANDGGRTLSILPGNGDGTFQAPVLVPIAGDELQGFTVVDLDGDSDLDVVVVNDQVGVLLNNGGVLAAPTFYGAGTGGLAVDTADFNGDGKADLVVADRDEDRLNLLLGVGDGTFLPATYRATGAGSQPFAVIARAADGRPLDFNRDGKADFATGYNGTGLVGVFLGDGAGGFVAAPALNTARPWAGRLTAADFDADGFLDLAVLGSGLGTVTTLPVFGGDGTGRFSSVLQLESYINTDVTAADLNGDGLPDILGTISFSPGYLVASLNTSPVVTAFEVTAPAAVTAGVPFTVTVTAKGAGGATFTGYRGTVRFASAGGAALPADTQFTPADNGVKTFTVTLNALGTQSFTLRDLVRTGVSATTPVTVFRANRPPTAGADTLMAAEDGPAAVVPVLANDSPAPDAGEALTVTAVTQPAHGVVTLVGGVVRYTPSPNYTGTDTFTYTITDDFTGPDGPRTSTGTVTVTVTPVNDPPTAVDDVLVIAEDSPATVVDVRFNDSIVPDAGEMLTVTAVTQPAHGVVTLVGGVVSYAPAADYHGPDSFTYTLSDGNGGTATATVAVTVFAVNDPPTATADTLTVAEDDPATVVPVLANDSAAPDTGETLTVTAVTQPAHGTVTLVRGVVQYTPAADYNGPDSFTYTVSDGNGGTATATVTVTVTPVNDPPTPAPDTLTVAEDAPATAVPVLANDSTAPDTGETLGVVSVTQPANGVVTLAGGVVTYTPAADYSGPDFFTYAVSDGASVTVVSVAVTVTPVNDPPTARGDAFSVAFNAPAITLAVLANDDTAPDAGETLTVTAVTQPAAGGAVAVAPGGAGVTFTPAAGFSGTATFTYTVGDDTPGGTATATVTVTVGGPPSFGPVRPVAVGGSADGTVRLTSADGTTTTVAPFGSTGTPTRTASADVDGDGVADVVAVTGPGTALQLAVLSGKDGSVLVAPFDPFGGGFAGGGYVAAADLDGDGRAEFVVTPDQGGGPRVTIFGLTPGGAPTTLANFFGIDDPNFRGGARGAVGDVDGDGTPDLIVAAGFGGGPRVAIFSGQSVAAGAPARLVNDFFAFPGGDATSLRNGAFVAAGDVTGDGFADLVFGGGPGGAPRVFILSGALVSAGDVAGAQASPVANFFVGGNLSDRGGARVGVTNADGDDRADLVVGSGAGQPARVRLYLGKTITGGGEPAGAINLDPPGGGALTDGVYVG
jgi:uncharacterized delta-60 repeat protein